MRVSQINHCSFCVDLNSATLIKRGASFDKVDALHRSLFRVLLTYMMEDPHLIGTGMELSLVSRNLERVADLATNIAEDVVYLIEGAIVRYRHTEART